MNQLTIYTDGASRGNPGNAASAWLIMKGTEILESEVLVLGEKTNNYAEYSALLGALSSAKKYGDPKNIELNIFSDSKLVISQMNGEYQVRSPDLKPLHEKADLLAKNFSSVSYHHVPREDPYIGACDWLCNDALNTLMSAELQAKKPETFCVTPIGYVSSPFKEKGSTPNQGRNTDEISKITLDPQYCEGLFGLLEGQDIFVMCWFDKSDRSILKVHRRGGPGGKISGVFACRSPVRPNPISLTLVKLLAIEENVLTVLGLEAFDGTPVLDIKPYSEGIDTPRE